MDFEQKDISSLVWAAVKLGLENASNRQPTAWLPFALDALLAEECDNSKSFARMKKEADDERDTTVAHWQLVGAYIQASKDAGYLRPLVREADPEAADLLARGTLDG